MSLILNIETATTACSVALAENGSVLAYRELDEGYTHAENLHEFIAGVLKSAGTRPRDLNAIAVSRGPGSYTGLRIGSSTAKGLAYALDIPLISVDTLQVMSSAATEVLREPVRFCPMIDARRMEVYTALYSHELEELQACEALVVNESVIDKFGTGSVCFFGNGMEKCRHLLQLIPGAIFLSGIMPSARSMSLLSFRKLRAGMHEDIAYFEPFYLKDFIAGKKKESGV